MLGDSSPCAPCILAGLTTRGTCCLFVLDCVFKDVCGEQSWMIEIMLPSEAKGRYACIDRFVFPQVRVPLQEGYSLYVQVSHGPLCDTLWKLELGKCKKMQIGVCYCCCCG